MHVYKCFQEQMFGWIQRGTSGIMRFKAKPALQKVMRPCAIASRRVCLSHWALEVLFWGFACMLERVCGWQEAFPPRGFNLGMKNQFRARGKVNLTAESTWCRLANNRGPAATRPGIKPCWPPPCVLGGYPALTIAPLGRPPHQRPVW